MLPKAAQCEHCGSARVVNVVDDLWKCNECDDFFDSEDTQRGEKFRRKSKWVDDDDE